MCTYSQSVGPVFISLLSYCVSGAAAKMVASSDHGEAWPTYGELMNMLKTSKTKAETMCNSGVADLLTAEFQHKFPQLPIGRPSTFWTLQWLGAPTMPSISSWTKKDGWFPLP
jgi:hypothetical protein